MILVALLLVVAYLTGAIPTSFIIGNRPVCKPLSTSAIDRGIGVISKLATVCSAP
jgi:glycerol-3-phosphate acyltransferase PlsY